MKVLIEKMNGILSDWKVKFDIMSKMKMEFCLNEENKICLNNHVIHMPTNLTLASADFDAENIRFKFVETKKCLMIGILWKEDSIPEVDTIRFGYESEI